MLFEYLFLYQTQTLVLRVKRQTEKKNVDHIQKPRLTQRDVGFPSRQRKLVFDVFSCKGRVGSHGEEKDTGAHHTEHVH